MTKKYIQCDNCYKPIYEGDAVFIHNDEDYYCSQECFENANLWATTLDKDELWNQYHRLRWYEEEVQTENTNNKGEATMERKFILCDHCNKRIYFGEEVYNDGVHCGTFCSAECYAVAYGSTFELNEEYAENCCCEVYTEQTIEQQKEEIQKQIKELGAKLASLSQI